MTLAMLRRMASPAKPLALHDANGDPIGPVVALQSALDLESFWTACVALLDSRMPHVSCSLMFDIVDFQPASAKHRVARARDPDYVPATSLTISGPFLARHPQVSLYTYSQIASEDPDAHRRRLDQEPDPQWNEFVHLAFWREGRPEAILSIHRESRLTAEERAFLEQLHPMVEAGLRRLRALDAEWTRRAAYENFLRRMPLSVMFVSTDGKVMFATPEAQKQCDRWERGLRNTILETLPETIVRTLGHKAGPVKLDHPNLPGLSARVELGWQNPELKLHPYYTVSLTDQSTASTEVEALSEGALALLEQLTPSERRVALKVALGLRNEEIAQQLSRSRRTVEYQLNSIYRKLNIDGRNQLIRALS